MKYILNFILSVILIFLLFSCEGGLVIEEDRLDTEFYPAEMGHSWTYRMDSIVYDNMGLTVIESSSFLRERLIQEIITDGGDTLFVLEISKSKDTLNGWTVTDLWTLEKNNNFVRRTEENLSFVKMVFPSLLGTTWEGNQFDQNEIEVLIAGDVVKVYENWDYLVLDRLQSLNNGVAEYDDVILLQQADSENLVRRRYSIEYYAKEVGLIQREMMILDIICSGPEDCNEGLPWEEKAHQGFILSQTLIDFQK